MATFRVIDKLLIALPTNQSISSAVNTYPAMHVLQIGLVLLTEPSYHNESSDSVFRKKLDALKNVLILKRFFLFIATLLLPKSKAQF